MNLIRMEKKGDVEKMKEEIKQEDRQQFERDGNVFAVLFRNTTDTDSPNALSGLCWHWNMGGTGLRYIFICAQG